MYAYCGNNPIMRVDPNGEGWILAIATVIGLVLTLTSCTPNEPSSPPEKTSISEDDINLYSGTEGARVEGKINVKFSPDNLAEDGTPNPSFQIENSYTITDSKQQEFVLNYIMESEFYDEEVYGRTMNSMLIEWDAHNYLYTISGHNRLAHTDFDKNSEGWQKENYYRYAAQEVWFEIIDN